MSCGELVAVTDRDGADLKWPVQALGSREEKLKLAQVVCPGDSSDFAFFRPRDGRPTPFLATAKPRFEKGSSLALCSPRLAFQSRSSSWHSRQPPLLPLVSPC
jgi:hypothetical protein